MSELKDTAELYAKGARGNYEKYGDLTPLLAFHTGNRVVMVTVAADTDQMAERFAMIVGALVGRFQPDTVTLVFESWTRRYSEKVRPLRLERGQLGRDAAAGDTTVSTALVTTAWRREPAETVTIMDTVVEGGYDRTLLDEPQGGMIPEYVLAGWEVGLDNVPPADLTDEMLLGFLAEAGTITSGSIQEWDEP